MRTLDEALERVARARVPSDLFGPDAAEAGRTYRRLARLVHPDATGGRTHADFRHLNALWRRYREPAHGTITTRRHTYRVGPKRTSGDIADLFEVRYGDRDRPALLKMPRDPRDSDLMEREADALRTLFRRGDERFRPYAPRLVEAFRHHDADGGGEWHGGARQVSVLAELDGFVDLARVREARPGGVDPRDAAWMWRRLLVAVGFAHRAGVLHGAVLPSHVLIHPEQHGLVLVDWCYSVVGGGRVPALVDQYSHLYPPEVTARRAADPSTDIYMATRCMTELMGDLAPKPLRAFARGCLLPERTRRPGDAWRLLGEFDELLERLYGPRRFRPFTLDDH